MFNFKNIQREEIQYTDFVVRTIGCNCNWKEQVYMVYFKVYMNNINDLHEHNICVSFIFDVNEWAKFIYRVFRF